MGADLLDLAALEDDQTVGVFQGGKAVGDGKRRAPFYQAGDGVLNLLLGVCVYRGSGLIQDQNARIVENGAGNGDALALAAGKRLPALPDLRIVAVGLTGDEIVGVRGFGRRHYLFDGRAGLGVADVLGDGAVKQKGVLKHDADLRAQIVLADALDIHAVHQNLPGIDIVEAAQQVNGGGFARAAVADQPDHLARRNIQVDVLKHGLV